jgi:electron-transferring-flavoprotein dehydrogenase
MDPRALSELFPQWRELGAPLNQAVPEDRFLFLSEKGARATPSFFLPDCFRNHGNFIVSLGQVVRWLGQQAEVLSVEIFPGFAAAEVLYGRDGSIKGIATGNLDIGRNGEAGEHFQPGVEVHAQYTVFAEGSRGHLGRQVIARYGPDHRREPQSYFRPEVKPAKHQPGLVIHTVGWPLEADTYGGSFLYHAENNQVALGFVVRLDYANPCLSPFGEFQRWKTHPAVRTTLEGGKCVGYGARAMTAGGILSLPNLVVPGGTLVGWEAGFLNASRIKGSHAAIKTGILTAEAIHYALKAGRSGDRLDAYPTAFERSSLRDELDRARNFKQWFKRGRAIATLMTGVEQWLLPKLGIQAPPWTIHRTAADHTSLKPAAECKKFAGHETRYCPAGVYEFVPEELGGERLQINAQNCVHGKTRDIKDPTQNIVSVAPEGGGGPNYAGHVNTH